MSATANQLINTQFGPIPRDQLVFIDTVEEFVDVFTTNRKWYMRSVIQARLPDGSEREVEALIFARNDVNAQVLNGQGFGAMVDVKDNADTTEQLAANKA